MTREEKLEIAAALCWNDLDGQRWAWLAGQVERLPGRRLDEFKALCEAALRDYEGLDKTGKGSQNRPAQP